MADERRRSETEKMIAALYEDALESGLKYLVAHRGDFAGRWFGAVKAGVDQAIRWAKESDVYIGVGLRREATPKGQRGTADGVDGIVGLWADLDVAGPAHKKKNLIPDKDAAIEFARSVLYSAPPSIIIDSGNGVQGWWLFSEPWIFEDSEERANAKTLSRRFSATLKVAAKPKGWSIDSVFDLARVLRLAGTLNHKSDPPKPSRIVELELDRRYDVDDLEALLIAPEFIPTELGGSRAVEEVGALTLGEKRRPNEDRLLSLLSNEELARASWENKREDFSDKSASSFDMSLALFAVRAGWADQEIADLLIAHRVKHGHDLKTTRGGYIRQDYYQRTIANARAAVGRERAVADLEAQSGDTPSTYGGALNDAERSKILRAATYTFGVQVSRFVQYGAGEDAVFILELIDGEAITIGTSKQIENQKHWRAKLYPVVGRMFEPVKPSAWIKLLNDLGLIREVESNPESSMNAQISAVLSEYFAARLHSREEEVEAAISSGDPHVRGGKVFLNRTRFQSWARQALGSRFDVADFFVTLRGMGFTVSDVSVRRGGRVRSRKFWSAPIDEVGERLGMLHSALEDAKEGAIHDSGR